MQELIEKDYLKKYKRLIGIDESGRGPLAGPVFVGAVLVESESEMLLLSKIGKDSKSLTPKEREKRYFQIIRNFKHFSNYASSKNIDEVNIFKATENTMIKLISRIIFDNNNNDNDEVFTIIDGNYFKIPYPYKCIVKGDQISSLIGAASIIAKYERDLYMQKLHEIYPYYDFANNKGYPTKKHVENIKRYGIIKEHRVTFDPIKTFIRQGIIKD
ncbi:ribonuclease HII [Petrotoga sp. 9PWA.NaAc.5.4]|uniref:ribonuclease HII n=1 Tax=Petrotoga sp. 9PWA.NaAc.5.4 TaxID=1434328 RepID=UPI000EFCB04A|nr:ribonuclease HII [Petrotoga sp. 9PWA.NaAc.5.4]